VTGKGGKHFGMKVFKWISALHSKNVSRLETHETFTERKRQGQNTGKPAAYTFALQSAELGACSQKSMQEGGNTEKLIKIEKDGKLVRQCTTGVFTDAQSKGMAWKNLQTFQSSC